MINARDNEKRRVVPRWRSPDTALATGEVLSSDDVAPVDQEALASDLTIASSRFRDVPNLGTAAELIASATLLNQPKEAIEAAEFVIGHERSAGQLLTDRARNLLFAVSGQYSSRAFPSDPKEVVSHQKNYGAIAGLVRPLRKRVKSDPHDSLAWLEMGRIHATVGNLSHAMRSVQTALALASQSRLVLRSASRFFLHAGDPELALETLRRQPRTKIDPWLSAAEIAVSQIIGKTALTSKSSKGLIDSGKFSDLEVSELRTALATTSLIDGRRKDARAHLRAALVQPTENAVAQAFWVAKNGALDDLLELLTGKLDSTPTSFEARAFANFNSGNWSEAASEAVNWFEDEPFSGRAAIQASLVLGVAQDENQAAVDILESAVRASPSNSTIHTNLIYNLAQVGRLQDAATHLRTLRHLPSENGAVADVYLLANAGLLLMKERRVDAGRRLYREAISTADRLGLHELATLASLYLLGEELAIRNVDALPDADAILADQSPRSPNIRLVLHRISRLRSKLVLERNDA